MKIVVLLLMLLVAAVGSARAGEIIHPPGGGAPVEGTVLPAVQGGTGVDGQHTWTDGRCIQVGTDVDGKRILQTTADACGGGGGGGAATDVVCTDCVGPTDLAPTTVTGTACTNCNLSYDADGRITAAANGTAGGGSFDPSLVNDVTWGNDSDADMTWTFNSAGLNDSKLVAKNNSLTVASTGPVTLALDDLSIANGAGVLDTSIYAYCIAGPACQTVMNHLVTGGVTSNFLTAQSAGEILLGDPNTPFVQLRASGTGDGAVRVPAQSIGVGEVATATFNDVTWGDNTDDGMLWTFNAAGAADPAFRFFTGGMEFGANASYFFDSSVWFQAIGLEGQGIQYDAPTLTMAPVGSGILKANAYVGTLPIANGGTNATGFTANRCVRFDGTRLVSAPADCGAGGGPTSTAVTPTPTPTLTPTPQPTATFVAGNAIDLTAGVLDFDPTELTNFTISDGSAATATTTYNLSGATDPSLTAENFGFTIAASSQPVLKMDDTHIANGTQPDMALTTVCGGTTACSVILNHALSATTSTSVFFAGNTGTVDIGDNSTPAITLQTNGTGTELACGGSGSNLCTVAANPTADLGIATKGYVDTRSGYTRIRYAASTAKTNNTTLSNDAGSGMNLVGFPVAAAGGLAYKIEADLSVASPAAADIKLAISGPASSCNISANNLNGTAPLYGTSGTCTASPTAIVIGTTGGGDLIRVSGLFVAASAGTVSLQWAQNTADPGSTLLAAGSWMTVTAVREADVSFATEKDIPDPWPPPAAPLPSGETLP